MYCILIKRKDFVYTLEDFSRLYKTLQNFIWQPHYRHLIKMAPGRVMVFETARSRATSLRSIAARRLANDSPLDCRYHYVVAPYDVPL